MSQDEGMSESPVQTLENASVSDLSGHETSHPFDILRGMGSPMLQWVTMPDSG